uniref:Uncharacterized protein n=1 Tax=Chromera velia CCMP2878 TaxID=1169474 RepID=A0A0G4H6U8_9ALVE|eukprot:Cvel_24897.t1-p1 / transcript=Cvel_24897.t1 / gene=Cvel_24897 / organism=Chromera_velia_CCMP2878 / gene_product=hypothetical protein / transcript_product=hypothetical protein / location=Cvel_scaffold2751:23756-23995(-) / protein_length=80 / sequence_SO=supercontig / SO=protein_coding / is_pseudo=false
MSEVTTPSSTIRTVKEEEETEEEFLDSPPLLEILSSVKIKDTVKEEENIDKYGKNSKRVNKKQPHKRLLERSGEYRGQKT